MEIANQCLTSQGLALLNAAQAGTATIEFTKLTAGNGTYSDTTTETLQEMTAMKSQKQSFNFNVCSLYSDTMVMLKGTVSNEELTTGYNVTEVGAWAKDSSDNSAEEILYAIVVASTPDVLPAYNGQVPSTINETFYLEVGNATNVTVEIAPTLTVYDEATGDEYNIVVESGKIYLEDEDGNKSDGSSVTGVKGDAESTYRQGNVNIDLADLGVTATAEELNYLSGADSNIQDQLDAKLATDGDAKSNTVTFTSSDSSDSSVTKTTGWTTVTKLASGSTLATLFNSVSKAVKNTRWLYKFIIGNIMPDNSTYEEVAYNVGDVVAYGNKLYICTTACSAGAWTANSSCFTESTLLAAHNELNKVKGNNAGFHNSIYRGKYLGSSVTTDQYTAISNGTFDDMYIGDYWTINEVNYRIAAFDYWINTGDTACTTHHVVLVPDSNLDTKAMNSTNTTSGGYVGSAMYSTNIATAKSEVTTAFGSAHILSHREYLTNAITNGYPSAGAWYDSTVDLMNEAMVYGSDFFAPHNSLGATIPIAYTIDKSQLPLFRLRHDLIGIRASWWLRDVVSSMHFAFVGASGDCDHANASGSFGVRPVFGICA